MKKSIWSLCFVAACCVAPRWAGAQPADPDGELAESSDITYDASGTAGAPDSARTDETYLPGPGGGTIDRYGGPVFESTGLEDGIGGCKCSSALGAPSQSFAPLLTVIASLALLKRRRSR